MTILHAIALVLIVLTVLFIGILPLLAVAMKDQDNNGDNDWNDGSQHIKRAS